MSVGPLTWTLVQVVLLVPFNCMPYKILCQFVCKKSAEIYSKNLIASPQVFTAFNYAHSNSNIKKLVVFSFKIFKLIQYPFPVKAFVCNFKI